MIIRYDSTAELRAAYFAKVSTTRAYAYDTSNAWYGGESEADTLRLALDGDTRLVPSAETLLASLDTHIETPRRVWNRSPAGAYTVVPEYLAGIPTYMRRMAYEMDEQAPITILATTTSSAGISAEILAKRGTVILALVMALSRVRPVTLQQLAIMHGADADGETVITSTINTAPLDLATACYVLTSAGFARRLTYGLGKKLNGFDGNWPRKYRYGAPQSYYNYLKTKLVADPTKCLIIGAAELHDELLTNPLAWISKQISRFTHMQEEETVI